jgi:hypothetical protein
VTGKASTIGIDPFTNDQSINLCACFKQRNTESATLFAATAHQHVDLRERLAYVF